MNRRNILTLLAGLPFVGSWFVPTANPYAHLKQARDLLLPGLWEFQSEEIRFSIAIDYEMKALLITGQCLSNNRYLGFALTNEAILDNTYKTSFGPTLRNLVTLLKSPDYKEGYFV